MVLKTDKDNKMTGYVMTTIKNKHLAVDNSESYDILLEYFKMIGDRLDKMQEDFKKSEFDTEVKKKALSKFNQFNKQVYYSVITNKFYIGQFKEVDKDNNLSNSSRYFYHTLDKILYVGDIKVSSKLVGDEIEILFKNWLRFRKGLNLSEKEKDIFLEDYEYLKKPSNEYIDIDSRITFGYYVKVIQASENLKEKFVNSYFPDLNYRIDSSFIDFATVYLVNKDKTLLPNYKISGVVCSETKSSVIRTFEQEIQLAELTGYSSVGEYTRTTTFRNKLKDISKRMTSFTTDFARLTIKNYCIENYK